MNKEFCDLLRNNFGFIQALPTCNDGWFLLIWKLCNDIKEHLDKMDQKTKNELETTQIKEKLGGLRFYVTSYINADIEKQIYIAENESFNICDWCGRDGTLYNDGVCYRTRCVDHRDTRKVYISNTLG